ncbi:MAG: FAD binding domain-containing protein [Anaerolineaceae bacterium]|jgi:CO/xanthine dehydrogenase FAD-binding subunit
MILEYHRPENLDEALSLLSRKTPTTVPMGGGTVLSQTHATEFAVVDLQALGLNNFKVVGNGFEVGAVCTLQALYEQTAISEKLKSAIQLESTQNIRETATIAGALVTADGRSAFACSMMALDTQLFWLPGEKKVSLGDWYSSRSTWKDGKMITKISFAKNAVLELEVVNRTPDDLPIVCAAAARWPSGRIRLILGGWGKQPILVADGEGLSPDDASRAASDAYGEAGDAWATAEYRKGIAGTLASRVIGRLQVQ